MAAPSLGVSTLFGIDLKWLSLATLTVQNASLTIIMHYARVTNTGAQYSAATAVLLSELLKGSISVLVALNGVSVGLASSMNGYLPLVVGAGGGPNGSASSAAVSGDGPRSHISRFLASPLLTAAPYRALVGAVFSSDAYKLSVPAILYVIQNNLQYVAASNLDVATFAVLSQMKILTTAGFSVLMLGKRLVRSQWIALGLLAFGVGIVQVQSLGRRDHDISAHRRQGNPMMGFLAVLASSMTSGLAGVYFEKVLKGSTVDLWIRNVQLSGFSLIPAIVPIFFARSGSTVGGSIFAHFGFWAYLTIAIQVFGGLLTAVVIKYSDNILKGFATSLAVIISFAAGIFIFGYSVTSSFVLGGSVVLGATYLYNEGEQAAKRKDTADWRDRLSTESIEAVGLATARRASPISKEHDNYGSKA